MIWWKAASRSIIQTCNKKLMVCWELLHVHTPCYETGEWMKIRFYLGHSSRHFYIFSVLFLIFHVWYVSACIFSVQPKLTLVGNQSLVFSQGCMHVMLNSILDKLMFCPCSILYYFSGHTVSYFPSFTWWCFSLLKTLQFKNDSEPWIPVHHFLLCGVKQPRVLL